MFAVPLFVAWAAAVLLAVLDGRRRYVGTIGVGALAIAWLATVAVAFEVVARGPIVSVAGGWPLNVGIAFRIDAMGAAFAVLSLGVLLVALAYEVIRGVRTHTFPALVLFLAVGLTGLFYTGDAFNFYVFFEVSMTSAFVLASYGGGGIVARATLIFVIINLIGSALFLGGIAALYHITGTLDIAAIAAAAVTANPDSVLLEATLIFVALSIKLGLFPFHYWLPPVYRDTQPVVAAILAGALANIGSYGLLRLGADMLPATVQIAAPVLLVLGIVSILYGEILAIANSPTREVLAYSSIGQAGYIVTALAIGGPAGYLAALVYAVANGLNKSLLFLASGLRGGMVGSGFAVGALSVAGVPPSIGFFGKLLLFQAAIAAGQPAIAALLVLGGALSFLYMFGLYQRTYWVHDEGGRPSPVAARLLTVVIAALLVLGGLWPEPVLVVLSSAVQSIAEAAR